MPRYRVFLEATYAVVLDAASKADAVVAAAEAATDYQFYADDPGDFRTLIEIRVTNCDGEEDEVEEITGEV
jgi:hypothetical protein